MSVIYSITHWSQTSSLVIATRLKHFVMTRSSLVKPQDAPIGQGH